jgi:transposase
MMLEHLDELDEAITQCDALVEELVRPFQEQVERLRTVPGLERRAAEDIIAETGVDMSVFPSHKHLCSWAGLCPGDHESGGKRKSGRMRPGNRYLRAVLTQCAHSVGRSKKTYYGARYGRLAKRKGKPRAAMAIAHDILEAVYFLLRDEVEFVELGPDFLDQLQRDYQIRYHTRRLRELGVELTIPQALAA